MSSDNDDAAAAQSRSGGQFDTAATVLVAIAVGVTSMSFNVWYPFIPLYMLDLGATSDADALFWVAIASTVQGIARLASGPIWGVVSDHFGRKVMFLRALYFGALTGAVAAAVNAPWQIAIAFGLQGLFSGFIPAAVALVSVSVPDSKLTSALGWVTGAQYIGTTAGPAVGALLAIVFDYSGAILVASIVPVVAGTLVLLRVPADRPGTVTAVEGGKTSRARLEPFRLNYQFALAVFIYFIVFSLNQLVRLATPIALRGFEGNDDVAGIAGLTFSLAGLLSSFGVIFLAPATFKTGKLRTAFVVSGLIAAGGHVLLALAGSTLAFVSGFLLIGLVLSIMVPATNTLIAGSAPRSRRGTAFGIAGSAQAVSFMVGPAGAAVFAAVSLDAGFLLLGGILLGMAALVFATLREPQLKGD